MSRVRLVTTLWLTAILAGSCDTAQPGNGSSPARARTSLAVGAVSRHMRHLESYGLSGALLIAEKGRIVLDQVYGMADRSSGRPVGHDTLFDIASVSKQFTAAAVLKLQEEGRLRTTDLLGQYLPRVPEDKAAITLHQLLTHTSGIADPQSDSAVPAGRDAAVEELLSIPLDHPPGSTFSYSNTGYTLLAAVVELASGRTFEDYLRLRLFAPAGLRTTHCAWEIRPDLASVIAIGEGGYEGRFRSGDPRSRTDAWMLRGSGSVLSSTAELWRWYEALMAGTILSADSLSALFQTHTTAEADFLQYGYGWRIQQTARGTKLVWHSGWEGAFSAVLRSYVDEGVFVAFTSNVAVDLVPLREIVLRSAREGTIGEILFEGKADDVPRTIDSSVQPPRSFAGRYVLERGGALEVALEDGGLEVRPEGQEAVEALQPQARTSDSTLADRGRAALELAALVRAGGAGDDDARLGALDPYGFAGASAQVLRTEWRELENLLGAFERFEVLGTARVGLKGREVPVTQLRLHFQAGSEDYRLIWYGADETYLLNGASRGFRKILRQVEVRQFLHYDLLTGSSFVVVFEPPEGPVRTLRVTVDGVTAHARRSEPRPKG